MAARNDGKYTDQSDNLYDRLLNFYDLDIDNNLFDMLREFSDDEMRFDHCTHTPRSGCKPLKTLVYFDGAVLLQKSNISDKSLVSTRMCIYMHRHT